MKLSLPTTTPTLDSRYDDPKFFIVGPPRTGTSLLTVLLNQHPEIAIAQDTSIFAEFKNAVIYYNNTQAKKLDGCFFPLGVLGEDSGRVVRDMQFTLLDQMVDVIFGVFLSTFYKFHSVDTFIADPRKDRGTGLDYIKNLDLSDFLKEASMNRITMRHLFNYIINSIIDGAGLEGRIRGEKTPSHILQSRFLSQLYPDAKFINIIRNPISFIGSRRQRLDASITDHCAYYRYNLAHMMTDPSRAMTVRYEDLISSTDETLAKLHQFIEVDSTSSTSGTDIEPGVYQKYVGTKVDSSRDKQNFSMVNKQEQDEIISALKEEFETYYPDFLSV